MVCARSQQSWDHDEFMNERKYRTSSSLPCMYSASSSSIVGGQTMRVALTTLKLSSWCMDWDTPHDWVQYYSILDNFDKTRITTEYTTGSCTCGVCRVRCNESGMRMRKHVAVDWVTVIKTRIKTNETFGTRVCWTITNQAKDQLDCSGLLQECPSVSSSGLVPVTTQR